VQGRSPLPGYQWCPLASPLTGGCRGLRHLRGVWGCPSTSFTINLLPSRVREGPGVGPQMPPFLGNAKEVQGFSHAHAEYFIDNPYPNRVEYNQ